MTLIDWAGRWNPVPDASPCRVRLPAPHPTEPERRDGPAARAPQRVALALTPAEAADLPRWLPRVLAAADVRDADSVTVNLDEAASVHLTGLALLLSVLWRRVGPYGQVTLSGGSRALRAQLERLGLTPQDCRALVYGGVPLLTTQVPAGDCAGTAEAIPAQRGRADTGQRAGNQIPAPAARPRELARQQTVAAP